MSSLTGRHAIPGCVPTRYTLGPRRGSSVDEERWMGREGVLILSVPDDALIGVHCTHGLNRTGYLICKYMVARMKIDPNEAIRRFQDARGYHMERIEYVRNIRIPLEKRETRTSSSSASSTLTSRKREQKVENWRAEPRRVPHERNEANSVAYRSPLKGYYHEEDHSRSEGRYGRRRYPPGPRS